MKTLVCLHFLRRQPNVRYPSDQAGQLRTMVAPSTCKILTADTVSEIRRSRGLVLCRDELVRKPAQILGLASIVVQRIAGVAALAGPCHRALFHKILQIAHRGRPRSW